MGLTVLIMVTGSWPLVGPDPSTAKDSTAIQAAAACDPVVPIGAHMVFVLIVNVGGGLQGGYAKGEFERRKGVRADSRPLFDSFFTYMFAGVCPAARLVFCSVLLWC